MVVEGGKVRRKSALLKRGLFIGMTILLMLGILELASWGMWVVLTPFQLKDFKDHLISIANLGTERANDLEVIHPYLGWALNPDAAQVQAHEKGQMTVNSLGFVDTAPSIQHRSPERFVVGLFGGSVAHQMGMLREQAFEIAYPPAPL
jgi:hypothetical protein